MLNIENDIHYATLTVKQTLAFALKTKTPKQPPDGMSNKQYRHIVLNALLKILGIKDTVNTHVGNDV
jgi:ATP-binding cassette, subfamily G (WHITE), member 2, SNQ2